MMLGAVLLYIGVAAQVSIIPQPREVFLPSTAGNFILVPGAKFQVSDPQLQHAADFLRSYLEKYYAFSPKKAPLTSGKLGVIELSLRGGTGQKAGAYTLKTDGQGVHIEGDDPAGVFYGVQSLIQLLPTAKAASLQVPYVTIHDEPRFAYRGLHLDVARHFFPVSFVKEYIDYIALHKMNYFHWHLTDDQGWRIEIKKYPNLTKAGAYRDGTIIGRYPGTGNDNRRYGGFYTQEEIKEVVQYAADRYITVIPEIEMPGHAMAALTAYPNLGCTGGPYSVQQTWGVFDDVFCAGNEEVFTFLQDVIDEVVQLFPSRYIHIGGDECPKRRWKECPKCQKRMKEHQLKDEHELQSYFIQRMEKYVNGKGRTIIGWDEILEGGLAPNAIVMSWRGEKGGIEAANQHHQVIMTPNGYMYFDHTQTSHEDSVTIGGYTTIQKVYGYEPIPKALDASKEKYILGAQANVWTEYMHYPSKVEYMIFPRLSALSEVLWSPKDKRSWANFEPRLKTQFKRYELWGANYSKAFFDPRSTIPKPKK